MRKSLWDCDIWSYQGALLTQWRRHKRLMLGEFALPPLQSVPTQRSLGWSNVWMWGAWRWPSFSQSERQRTGKGLRGCQGSFSYHQNITCIIKKRLSPLLTTHTHRGFVSLVLLVLYFYVRHTFFCSMLELSLASYARKNIIRCFKNTAIYFTFVTRTEITEIKHCSQLNSNNIHCKCRLSQDQQLLVKKKKKSHS